ncbi:MAG: hypothetical protein ACNA8W_00380 [Bradymonadaceae bacterium]
MSTATALERKPLDLSIFPANLQKHVDPSAAAPLKMMAARGMVPAPPEQMLKMLYQLHFDEAVYKDVVKALKDMPENVLSPAVQTDQPPELLDWVADLRDGAVLDAVALNKNTSDQTIVRIAATANANLCDIIANNQVRVLRQPEIIERLYANANARMATVDKLVGLARENGIKLKALAGLEQALDSGEDLSTGGADDDVFAQLLLSEVAKAKAEDTKLSILEDDKLTRAEKERLRADLEGEDDNDEVEEKVIKRSGNLHSQIGEMNIAQKIRLATVGSRDAINILIRDPNKLIHMAAIRSPRLRAPDIRRIAANKSIPDGVIKYMAANKDWTRHYEVMVSLSSNPKTPLSDTMRFLNHLRTKELRDLSRNRNVAQQVSRMAKNLLQKRSGR